MNVSAISHTIAPRAGLLLTQVTETPDYDTALWAWFTLLVNDLYNSCGGSILRCGFCRSVQRLRTPATQYYL